MREIIEAVKPFDSRDFIIMAQDEARFGRINGAKKSWAPCNIRPLVPKQIVRKFTYAYSAVCPSMGEITSLILPYSNTQMINMFFMLYCIHMIKSGRPTGTNKHQD